MVICRVFAAVFFCSMAEALVSAVMDDEQQQLFEAGSPLSSPALSSTASTVTSTSGITEPEAFVSTASDSYSYLQAAVALVPCAATRNALTTIGTMVHGVDANLLKLMSHLGVTPVQRSRMGLMFLGSHLDSVNGLSSATKHTATPKPKCPWCQSSNFNCEKNLVQHLASAIRKIGVAPSKSSSCRFSAVLHSEVMGKASGVGTQNEAEAFMRGFKKCFVSGELVGFNPQRCAAAAEYLADFVRQ